MQIQHSQNIRVCLQRFVQLPDITKWNVTCSLYQEFNETQTTLRRSVISLSDVLAIRNSSAPFDANNDLYNWGVQVLDEKMNDTVTVWLSGNFCPEGQAYNGSECAGVTALEKDKPSKILLNPKDIGVFSFNIGYGLKSLSVAMTNPSDDTAVFKSYLRLNGVPSSMYNDKSGDSKVTMDYPQPGLWYAAVELDSPDPDMDLATDVSVTLSYESCPPLSYGPNCNTTVTTVNSNFLSVARLKVDGFVYFQATPTKDNPTLQIAFQSSQSAIGISVYGSIGNLPSPDNYLIKGCNQEFCHSVTNIMLNNSTNTLFGNETWIFAVTTADNDTDVGAWINSVCAPTCDSPSGECQSDGPDTGLCLCEDSYIGIDCTVAVGLPSQYIVLIIIAGLVLSSAVIGFIAWAYMRSRRRVQYEKVV
jgi:hypothetical protein